MNTHTNKTQETKSRSVANEVFQKQRGSERTYQFVDRRPEAIVQRNLQAMANDSSRIKQLSAIQRMADSSTQPKIVQRTELTIPGREKSEYSEVSSDYLEQALAYVENEGLREELRHAASYAQGKHTLVHANDPKECCAYRENVEPFRVVIVVPPNPTGMIRALAGYTDLNTPTAAATVHEIIHIAEKIANEENHRTDFSTPDPYDLDTGLSNVKRNLDFAIRSFEREEDTFDIEIHNNYTGPMGQRAQLLSHHIFERLTYAKQRRLGDRLESQDTNKEIPTVVSQLIIAIRNELPGYRGDFLRELQALESALHEDRARRRGMNSRDWVLTSRRHLEDKKNK
jgi:hypothetical protein